MQLAVLTTTTGLAGRVLAAIEPVGAVGQAITVVVDTVIANFWIRWRLSAGRIFIAVVVVAVDLAVAVVVSACTPEVIAFS